MATLEPVTPGLQKLEIGELLSLGKGEDWEKRKSSRCLRVRTHWKGGEHRGNRTSTEAGLVAFKEPRQKP